MSHRLEALAHGNRLRLLPPGHKAAFAATLLLLALVAPPPVQLLISLWLALWTIVYAGIPAATYLPMLLLPLGFALSSLPAIVINGVGHGAFAGVHADVWQGLSQPVAGWTLYISKLGLSQTSGLLTRSLAATSALFFLLLTTPFNELMQVLRKLALPPLLLELMVYVYGFIFTLWAIADEIAVAQRARSGYSSRRRSLRSLGLLIGQLLERSMASYRGLAMGLAARGFQGELRVVSCVNHRPSTRYQAEAIGGCALLGVLSIAWLR
ncbi:MAG: cobalt ECF transporter T component CbiQ [Synechococcaceae cyanobacterium ELA445]